MKLTADVRPGRSVSELTSLEQTVVVVNPDSLASDIDASLVSSSGSVSEVSSSVDSSSPIL